MYAIAHGHELLAKQLLLAGADYHYSDEEYLFLLNMALSIRSAGCTRLVLQRMVCRSVAFDLDHIYAISSQIAFLSIPYGNPYNAEDFEDILTVQLAVVSRAFCDELFDIRHPFLSEALFMKTAFDLMRERLAEVCIALQSLRLPVLLTVMVLEESCEPPNANLRMYDTWRVAALVKHFIA